MVRIMKPKHQSGTTNSDLFSYSNSKENEKINIIGKRTIELDMQSNTILFDTSILEKTENTRERFIVPLHSKLDETTSEELSLRLESAEDLKTRIICLIIKKDDKNDFIALEKFCKFIDEIKDDNCSFFIYRSERSIKI